MDYWKQVDLYVGGSEHATGHLLYVRFWTKFLFDRGHIAVDEPAQKLVNQGMITGRSARIWRIEIGVGLSEPHVGVDVPLPQVFVSADVIEAWRRDESLMSTSYKVVRSALDEVSTLMRARLGIPSLEYVCAANFNGLRAHGVLMPVEHLVPDANGIISNDETRVNVDAIVASNEGLSSAVFVRGGEHFHAYRETDKMSKSKWNVVNPDDIIEKYGADTLRLYEMFLGPLEQSKPWDTNGIEGTSRFLKKFWNLFFESDILSVSDVAATKAELKVLHATLKKVTEDIEKLSFNTSVSQFMIAVNELGALKCHKRDVLEPLTIALAPFAPHIAEEELVELARSHRQHHHRPAPVAGRAPGGGQLQLSHQLARRACSSNSPWNPDAKSVEAAVLANPEVQARLEGKLPKKVIVVPKRIVNIVI